MLTDAELAAIQVANAQTTPGPWFFAKANDTFYVMALKGRVLIARVESGDTSTAAWIGQSRQYVPALLAEVERLRAENAALREIVQAVATMPMPRTDMDNLYCPFCHEEGDEETIEHTADCSVTKARALLGKEAQAEE